MRFSIIPAIVIASATQSVIANTWFSKGVYNQWHQSELERWLSDHDITYPTPADRKDLENLVKDNWQDYVVTPYHNWSIQQLLNYLQARGLAVKTDVEQNSQHLVDLVRSSWHETEDQASGAYRNVNDWIFDTWTESQLESFLKQHHVPSPQPRSWDGLIAAARTNYQTIAKTAGETASYPGNWLYATWSDSELKAWLDERGYPVPMIGSRDKMVALIRHNSHLASQPFLKAQASASVLMESPKETAVDAILDSWSDSTIKEWCDRNGITTPRGSTRDDLLSLVRKHRAKPIENNISTSATSAFGAATRNAGNQYSRVVSSVNDAENWIESKLGIADESVSTSVAAFGSSESPPSEKNAASQSFRPIREEL